MTMQDKDFTDQQLDGFACARCGRDFGPGSTSTPDRSNRLGMFVCSDGFGCSGDDSAESADYYATGRDARDPYGEGSYDEGAE
jgi:hypothetical protein